jgi:hypothetical protein
MAELSIAVEKNVATPMRAGVVLRADVYRPAAVGKYPMLLQRTPYNKNFNLISTLLLDVMRAASEGYVVVIQDSRGRYASEGEFYPFRDDILDGYDTVEWCAAQSWSNGAAKRELLPGWSIASIGLSLIARRILTNLNRSSPVGSQRQGGGGFARAARRGSRHATVRFPFGRTRKGDAQSSLLVLPARSLRPGARRVEPGLCSVHPLAGAGGGRGVSGRDMVARHTE